MRTATASEIKYMIKYGNHLRFESGAAKIPDNEARLTTVTDSNIPIQAKLIFKKIIKNVTLITHGLQNFFVKKLFVKFLTIEHLIVSAKKNISGILVIHHFTIKR